MGRHGRIVGLVVINLILLSLLVPPLVQNEINGIEFTRETNLVANNTIANNFLQLPTGDLLIVTREGNVSLIKTPVTGQVIWINQLNISNVIDLYLNTDGQPTLISINKKIAYITITNTIGVILEQHQVPLWEQFDGRSNSSLEFQFVNSVPGNNSDSILVFKYYYNLFKLPTSIEAGLLLLSINPNGKLAWSQIKPYDQFLSNINFNTAESYLDFEPNPVLKTQNRHYLITHSYTSSGQKLIVFSYFFEDFIFSHEPIILSNDYGHVLKEDEEGNILILSPPTSKDEDPPVPLTLIKVDPEGEILDRYGIRTNLLESWGSISAQDSINREDGSSVILTDHRSRWIFELDAEQNMVWEYLFAENRERVAMVESRTATSHTITILTNTQFLRSGGGFVNEIALEVLKVYISPTILTKTYDFLYLNQVFLLIPAIFWVLTILLLIKELKRNPDVYQDSLLYPHN